MLHSILDANIHSLHNLCLNGKDFKNYGLQNAITHHDTNIYTVVHKKQETFIFLITLANIDGFS